MPLRASEGTFVVLERPSSRTDLLSGDHLLSVPLHYVEESNWCWAACAVMVARYYGDGFIQQCMLADYLFGQTNCCSTPSAFVCNKGALSELVCTLYQGACALQCHGQNGDISLASIQFEIDQGRPIQCNFDWSVGGSHTVIVRGYYESPTPLYGYVHVNDPLEGEGAITYEDLQSAYGLGVWNYTY